MAQKPSPNLINDTFKALGIASNAPIYAPGLVDGTFEALAGRKAAPSAPTRAAVSERMAGRSSVPAKAQTKAELNKAAAAWVSAAIKDQRQQQVQVRQTSKTSANGTINNAKDQSKLVPQGGLTFVGGTPGGAPTKRTVATLPVGANGLPMPRTILGGAPVPAVQSNDMKLMRSPQMGPGKVAVAPVPAVQTNDMKLMRSPQMGPGGQGAGNGLDTAGTYTVKAGDTLSSIAARTLGNANAYRQIATANGISNPNKLAVGTVLRIGGGSAPAATTARSAPAATPARSGGGTVLTSVPIKKPVAATPRASSSGFTVRGSDTNSNGSLV
jgi:nucleoid-associated protein YgaU